jgi:hypothetical protein
MIGGKKGRKSAVMMAENCHDAGMRVGCCDEKFCGGVAAGCDVPTHVGHVGFWIVMGPARERVRQSGDSLV